MGSDERQRGQDKGPTGLGIGQNVRRAREALGLDLAKASERLSAIRWPITKSALSRLETGQRRVDVDDLMALSVALHVSPLGLLLGDADIVIQPTGLDVHLDREEIWAWAAGDVSLDAGEIAEWWRSEAALADEQLKHARSVQDAMQDKTDGRNDHVLRLIADGIRASEQRAEYAQGRIRLLTGESPADKIISFESVPVDPTAEVRM